MPPLLTKVPEGTTHIVSFIWRPIFCKSETEAQGRLADIGDADTPHEFFKKNDPAKAKKMEADGRSINVVLRAR